MKRKSCTRYGCDMCKDEKAATYVFVHDRKMKLWICEKCFDALMEWPSMMREERR
jgi:hypothetical protein